MKILITIPPTKKALERASSHTLFSEAEITRLSAQAVGYNALVFDSFPWDVWTATPTHIVSSLFHFLTGPNHLGYVITHD